MDDKKFRERVPSLEQKNKTNTALTQGGFVDREKSEEKDSRSYFDEQGAARRRGVDDENPEE